MVSKDWMGSHGTGTLCKQLFSEEIFRISISKSNCVSLTKFEIPIEKKPIPGDQKIISKIFFSAKCSRKFATCLHNIFHILSIQFWYSNIEIHFLKIRWNNKEKKEKRYKNRDSSLLNYKNKHFWLRFGLANSINNPLKG